MTQGKEVPEGMVKNLESILLSRGRNTWIGTPVKNIETGEISVVTGDRNPGITRWLRLKNREDIVLHNIGPTRNVPWMSLTSLGGTDIFWSSFNDGDFTKHPITADDYTGIKKITED